MFKTGFDHVDGKAKQFWDVLKNALAISTDKNSYVPRQLEG